MNFEEVQSPSRSLLRYCAPGSVIKLGMEYFILSTLDPLGNSADTVILINLSSGSTKIAPKDLAVLVSKKTILKMEF